MYKVALFLNGMLSSSDLCNKQNSSATRKTFHRENQAFGELCNHILTLPSVSTLSPLPSVTMKVNKSLLF